MMHALTPHTVIPASPVIPASTVIPAQAGISAGFGIGGIPACAGMTKVEIVCD